jgi:tetratricopeptide (TPR) repeat protein
MLVINCKSCGTANEAGARFCLDCGRRLSVTSAAGETRQATAETQARPQVRTEVIALTLTQSGAASTSHASTQEAQQNHMSAPVAPSERSLIPAAETEPGAEESAGTRAVRELARASGLSSHSRFSARSRLLIAGLALLLTFGAWLIYRDQSQVSSAVNRNGLNLVAPDEISRLKIMVGERYRNEGNYEAAIEQFREALKLTPRDTQAQFLLARTYYSDGRVDEAIQTYSRLLETDPKHLEARLSLADIYRNRGQWSEAEREYRRIINLDPHSEQAQAAIDALEKTTAERPSNYSLLSALRRNSRNRRVDLPPAADHSSVTLPMSELALDTVPPVPSSGNEAEDNAEMERSRRNMAAAYKNRGIRFDSAKRHADAIREYQKALYLTPEDNDLHYLIGTAYFQGGQYAMAIEHYRKCTSGQYAAVARNSVRKADEAAHKAAKKQKK